MNMPKLIQRLAMAAAIAAVGLAVFGLIYRAAFYSLLPPSPAEAAGLADLLELLIFYGVLLLSLVAMGFGVLLLVVPDWRNLRLAISVLVTSLVTPPFYFILHGLVARLIH